MKFSKQTIIFCFILIAITTLVKVICAPQIDLSGITAALSVALFAGLCVKDKKYAFALPLITVFISDVLIQVLYSLNMFPFKGFYGGQVYNYLLLFALTLIGIGFRNFKTAGIFGAAIVGPTVFFLLSNFIVWKTQGAIMGYNKDVSGLMQSYAMGLPFYRNSLISTIVFLPSFIGLYQWMMFGKLQLMHTKS